MQRHAPESTAAGRADDGPLDPRAVEIWAWRVEQLERAGYSRPVAHRLADNGEVDLHVACDLLSRGCPEPTAFAILA